MNLLLTKNGKLAIRVLDEGEKNVSIDSSVEVLGFASFTGCEALTNLFLGSNVKRIEACAFNDCKSLETIYLSQNVKSVEESAFDGCSNLRYIYYEGSKDLEALRGHKMEEEIEKAVKHYVNATIDRCVVVYNVPQEWYKRCVLNF